MAGALAGSTILPAIARAAARTDSFSWSVALMKRRFECARPPRVHHAEIQRRWRWFRGVLNAPWLPRGFSPEEGDIQVIRASGSSPAELDPPSRAQHLRFSHESTQEVVVRVSFTDVGDDYRFTYHDSAGTVVVQASPMLAYCELEDTSAYLAAVECAAREYVVDDPRLPSRPCPCCGHARGIVHLTQGPLEVPAAVGPMEDVEHSFCCLECDEAFTSDVALLYTGVIERVRDGARYTFDWRKKRFVLTYSPRP